MIQFIFRLLNNFFVAAKSGKQILCAAVFCCLIACQGDLNIAEDRTQSQAVEIVSLLNQNGIAAYAEKGRTGNRYAVTVPARYYHQGISLVEQNELAADARPGVEELVENRSFLPGSRDTEKFRLDLALSMQLEDAIENLAGVISARAIVRKNFVDSPEQSGGTLTVQVQPGSSVTRDDLISIISSSLPEVKPDNFSIQISEQLPAGKDFNVQGAKRTKDGILMVPLRKFLFWQVPEGEHNGLAIAFLVAILITALIFSGLGFLFSHLRTLRAQAAEEMSENSMLGIAADRNNDKLPGI